MDLCQLPGLMTQASQLVKLEPVQPRTKAASVAAVDNAGILKLKVLYTVNIKMWRHPKYYKELRKLRNKLDQAISPEAHDGERERAPGPGPKQQAASDSQVVNQVKLSSQSQAASTKLQAALEATSIKPKK